MGSAPVPGLTQARPAVTLGTTATQPPDPRSIIVPRVELSVRSNSAEAVAGPGGALAAVELPQNEPALIWDCASAAAGAKRSAAARASLRNFFTTSPPHKQSSLYSV